MKLDELLRRGDACVFCGATIGPAAMGVCQECGHARPRAHEIARVQRAIWIGRAGLVVVVIPVGVIGCAAVYSTFGHGDQSSFGPLLFFGILVCVLFALCLPWFRAAAHAPTLFQSAWRRWLVALYPWAWIAIGVGTVLYVQSLDIAQS